MSRLTFLLTSVLALGLGLSVRAEAHGGPGGNHWATFSVSKSDHYRNRSFDPATGRFLQRDPVLGGDPMFNPYCFPGNNPVTGSDPMGLFDYDRKSGLESDDYVAYDIELAQQLPKGMQPPAISNADGILRYLTEGDGSIWNVNKPRLVFFNKKTKQLVPFGGVEYQNIGRKMYLYADWKERTRSKGFFLDAALLLSHPIESLSPSPTGEFGPMDKPSDKGKDPAGWYPGGMEQLETATAQGGAFVMEFLAIQVPLTVLPGSATLVGAGARPVIAGGTPLALPSAAGAATVAPEGIAGAVAGSKALPGAEAITGELKGSALAKGPASDVMVIGRQADTLGFAGQAGKQVLNIPRHMWRMGVNDGWITAGIKQRRAFLLATDPLTPGALSRISADGALTPTVFARELSQLEAAGYTRIGRLMLPPGL